jgi:hypothetical protein
MLLPYDHIGMCAQAQEFPSHENAHSKEMGYNCVYHIHTSIIETQVMISIEIHALNKVISVHGCESLHRDVQISSMPQVTPLNLHATFYNIMNDVK